MICPFCGSDNVKVTNTRLTRKDLETWRRRWCNDCKEAFTTYEKIDLSYLKVVKKDGRKVYYNRAKLYSGIYQATTNQKNVDRGDMGQLAEKMTEEIEKKILGLKTKEVSTEQIYALASEVLKKNNDGAFLHYVAYFKGKATNIKIG
ncbi:MAG TPA: ATP cone domain-containing protein [Candidatus Woesebacteria bacterium]|nr:ATP cone domain-containing protein [Candidatus Woesebacteria bacterium]